MFFGCGTGTAPGTAQSDPLGWARGIVWYQIFPERFRNGSAANDPTAAEVPGAELEPGWQVHPWTADWYRLQPWELRRSSNFYEVVFTRRYGGDLIGVIEKLDYLKQLGVQAIYFNPIFEAPSLHKYDASSYHHVDDNFGPDPKGDRARLARAEETEDPATWIWTSADSTFLRLIREAHRRGIRVVIDGVFNHSGTGFFAFQDILKNGPRSRYAHWYVIKRWDDPRTPQNELDYEAWWGFKSLPVFAENDSGLVHGPREYFFAITRRWMDPNGDGDPSDGVDGWRLDVITDVAPPFWEAWYALVKRINPEALTIGEIWDDASEWVAHHRIDASMNYLFARAVVAFFVNRRKAISGEEFAKRLQEMVGLYGESGLNLMWNLVDSHDTDRLASMILNPDRDYDRNAGPRDNPDYDVSKPGPAARRIQKQIVVFQMTFPGSPMIYYGDEAGMWGADDPDDRKPMVWPDLRFEVERSHPLPGHVRPPDPNGFDEALFEFYRRAIALRRRHPALQTGRFRLLKEFTGPVTLGFARTSGKEQVIALFSRADREVTMPISSQSLLAQNPSLVFGKAQIGHADNGSGALTVRLPARGFAVLVAKP
ncbi:MAG: glycoside hydrolase family 13 protein [Calditrichaeota bacterium]|nr:MAG: glycoside hydrolase family 13 protein [Calditrichota bacterium]